MKTTIPADLGKTLDLKILVWEALEEAAAEREAAKAKIRHRINLGYAVGISRREIARALGRTEGAIRDMERRGGK